MNTFILGYTTESDEYVIVNTKVNRIVFRSRAQHLVQRKVTEFNNESKMKQIELKRIA